jgi:hypothetical protein
MTPNAESEIETIRAILKLLEPYPRSARARVLGYVKHFLRTQPPGEA